MDIWQQTIYNNIDPMTLITGGSGATSVLWRGEGNLDNYYLWYAGALPKGGSSSTIQNQWIISTSLDIQIIVDGIEATGCWYDYNGKRYWDTGSNYLWYDSSSSKWIISSKLGCCITEEWYDGSGDSAEEAAGDEQNDNNYYIGDSWWESDTLEGLYIARGDQRGTIQGEYNGTPKKVKWELTAYRKKDDEDLNTDSEGKSGIYQKFERTATVNPDDTVDETINDVDEYIDVGCPQWVDQDDTTYTRSIEKDANGNYTYGDIHYNVSTGKWIIGVYNSTSGWYESNDKPELDTTTTVTFSREKTGDGSYPGNYDLDISFDKYLLCTEENNLWIAEAALWL